MLLERQGRVKPARRGSLFRGGKFVEDGLRCGPGIARRKNWAAYDDEISPGANRLGWSRRARLVIIRFGAAPLCRARVQSRTNARRYDQEISSAGFPDGFGLLCGGDNAI